MGTGDGGWMAAFYGRNGAVAMDTWYALPLAMYNLLREVE
jgi:hypothetical protein